MMNEPQCRQRAHQLANKKKKTANHPEDSLSETDMPGTYSQLNSHMNSNSINSNDSGGEENEIDMDRELDNEEENAESAKSKATSRSKGNRSKFSKNDKSDMVKLIYNEESEMVRFVKNGGINGDSEDDENEMMHSNDSKPLLRGKRDGHDSYYDDEFNVRVKDAESQEGLISLSFQVFVPFLIAGFGTVGAGLVLDIVQHWDVFLQISELFILVPALLGLKGNLEMTLASRLSTQANLGNLNSFRDQWLMASGNIALIQCQATVVGFLAAVFAILMDWLPEGEFNFDHAILLCASSLLTASIASFVLGLIMIGVVILSHKCNINPDNVATPIAASLGDLTTLALLANISHNLFVKIGDTQWLCPFIIFVFLALIPFWCLISANNLYTREVLFTGWTPVISAMAISSIGGCILDFAVARFKGIAVFQPVINGVGGNLVAVQASRISTYLHKRSSLGKLPKSDANLCFVPCTAFCGDNPHARTARILLLMVIPGHLVFTYGIRLLQAGHTSVTALFLVVYLSAALVQVILLLYFAHTMILWMWTKHIDPDNSAIPYLTALGDLLGTALLAIAFIVLFSIGDKDSDVGD